MSSMGTNIEKTLELVQKTYQLQTTTTTTTTNNNHFQTRPSVAKISTHQPSRKSSVHDIHEFTRDDLNKILTDIQENLSRLKLLLETTNSTTTIRDEFFKLKDHLFKRITEFIYKLSNDSRKRESITSKRNSITLISNHPQHLVYCIEYFRSELIKAQYLFFSLTLSASIGSATLNSITVKAIFNPTMDEIPSNNEDMQNLADLNEIKKDIFKLEEYIYALNQRYYSQIPDWHGLGPSMTGDGTLPNSDGLNSNRLRVGTFNPKLSRSSSAGSNENSHFCTHLYQKCQMICCICTPNYI